MTLAENLFGDEGGLVEQAEGMRDKARERRQLELDERDEELDRQDEEGEQNRQPGDEQTEICKNFEEADAAHEAGDRFENGTARVETDLRMRPGRRKSTVESDVPEA